MPQKNKTSSNLQKRVAGKHRLWTGWIKRVLGTPKNPQEKVAWVVKSFFILAVLGSALIALALVPVYVMVERGLPSVLTAADYRPPVVTRVLGASGKETEVLGEFFKERRYLVPFEKIPKRVVQAFLAAEDDKFYEHQGVNPASILRAAFANLKAGHVVQGGSTITQQVAKSLLSSEKSLTRKVRELVLSFRMERTLKKDEILYLYLNQLYLGRGAYGVQAAARVYFQKDVSELSIGEAAILAGMPQAPGKYSPNLNPGAAKKRQLYVLRRMMENNFITQKEMTDAAAEPLRLSLTDDPTRKIAPYLTEQIRRYVAEKYGEKALYEEGLTITTPVTSVLAVAARRSLQEGLRNIDKRIGYRGPEKTLSSEQEIEAFLKEQRRKLIAEKLGYTLLLPDGRLDLDAAFRGTAPRSEADLLTVEELYTGVVTSIDERRKVAGVAVGGAYGELSLEKMRWARPIREEGSRARGNPSSVGSVLARGDVLWVKVLSRNEKGLSLGLEQHPQVQGALLSIEAQTGFVLAMEGGYDFSDSEFNRAMQAMRQPGSAFKPIIYAAGVERGFTPSTIIQDTPIVYQDADASKWKPNNFEEKFYGDTTFRQSLIKSRNVPTIKIVQSIQVSYLLELVKRIGLEGKFSPDLSISLGSGAVSLFDLTKVYSLFPRLGRKIDPVWIQRIVDRDGKPLEERKASDSVIASEVKILTAAPGEEIAPIPGLMNGAIPGVATGLSTYPFPKYPRPAEPDQVMDPRIAYVMTHLMKEVVNYGTGYEAKNLGRPAAGKTGTTNDSIDAWFMGFTPDVVTGVWVGFDSQKPIGPAETGAKAALPIWLGYMKEAVKKYPDGDFRVPPGVVFATIDGQTGRLLPPTASSAIKEAYVAGTEPGAAAVVSAPSGDPEGAAVSGGAIAPKGSSALPSAGQTGGSVTPAPASDFIREELD